MQLRILPLGISNQLKTYSCCYLKTHYKQIICPHSLLAIKMQTHYIKTVLKTIYWNDFWFCNCKSELLFWKVSTAAAITYTDIYSLIIYYCVQYVVDVDIQYIVL